MKTKIIGICTVILLMLNTTILAFASFSRIDDQTKNQFFDTIPDLLPSIKTNEISSQTTFTHTVLCELHTTTSCPNCPTAVMALKNLYQNDTYQFYFVTLISDVNPNARQRALHYLRNVIPTYMATPSVYFDGGDQNMPGRLSSVNATEAAYREILEEVGNRTVTVPIQLSSEIVWVGDGKIAVTVRITNNGDKPYLGTVQSYVTEKVSRWKDQKGLAFNFGFLDFALNKFIFISAGETKTISTQWDATSAHGQNFGDISKDNLLVISTISDWMPHYRTGYVSELGVQKYFAYYVDQTTAAAPIS